MWNEIIKEFPEVDEIFIRQNSDGKVTGIRLLCNRKPRDGITVKVLHKLRNSNTVLENVAADILFYADDRYFSVLRRHN